VKNNAKNLIFLLFLLPVGLAAAGISWQEFTSGWFKVLMPGAPKSSTNGSWVAVDPQGRAYNVSAGRLSDPPADPEAYFEETAEKLAQGIQGQLSAEKHFQFHGAPAYEFRIDNAKHIVMDWMVYDHQELFVLQYAADTKTFDPKPMRKFFESFRITGKAPPPDKISKGDKPTPSSEPGQSVQPW
jgi:hypothetical protein